MTQHTLEVECYGFGCNNKISVSLSKAQELAQHQNPSPVFCSEECEEKYQKIEDEQLTHRNFHGFL